jgi:hypothetical protein
MKKKNNRIPTSSGAWYSVLIAVGVMALASTALADNMKLNREFNEDGNILIADQFNNRVIEIDPSGKIVWSFGRGPNDFSAKSIIGVNDAQRVGEDTLMAGTGTPAGGQSRHAGGPLRRYRLAVWPVRAKRLGAKLVEHAGAMHISPELRRAHYRSGQQPDHRGELLEKNRLVVSGFEHE